MHSLGQYSIGVAFARGDPHSWGDALIMDTTGGPFVHSEIILQNGKDVRSYTAVKYPHPCSESSFCTTGRRLPLPSNWEVVKFPVTEGAYKSAYAAVLQLMAMQLPYNSRDLWQCCFKLMLPFEKDYDCQNLATWRPNGVFCSQACLLLLRRLAVQGKLGMPPGLVLRLSSINSRGCSPNTLHRLLTRPR